MRPLIRNFSATALVFAFVCVGCSGSSPQDDVNLGGSDDTQSEQPSSSAPSSDPAGGRVWTLSEVLAEPRKGGLGGAPSCGGEFGFRRCVCAQDVPSALRYRPALAECNGNAAILLDGQYLDIFSVVVRDSQNRDRWPESGFNGCDFALSTSVSPPNRCSAFKVQESFPTPDGSAVVHCFGASGYSTLFRDVVRATIKITDDPNSSDDEIERLCLIAGDTPLN
jgi:hypothetical protein